MIQFEQLSDWNSEMAFWPDNNTRYLPFNEFKKELLSFQSDFQISVLGKSEKGKPIYGIRIGEGPKKIVMWSQMHGNETTGTYAILDVLKILSSHTQINSFIDQSFSLLIVPMVNPDGAEDFKRRNGLDIDLNRDARAVQATETKILMKAIAEFKPDLALNLHDQRPIFSVGNEAKPATISFLVPSFNSEKTIDDTRLWGMGLVGLLANSFPGKFKENVGRYSDEFYPTAFGDNLQKNGINCILIEAGCYFNDPKRNSARLLTVFSIFKVLQIVSEQNIPQSNEAYQAIPENKQLFKDILVTQIKLRNKKKPISADIAFKLEEKVVKNRLERTLIVDDIGDLSQYHAYQHIHGEGFEFNVSEIFIGKTFTFQEFQQTFWQGVVV